MAIYNNDRDPNDIAWERSNKKYSEKDFSYTYNAEGYMIQYKGHNIGGAGIMGKSYSRGKKRSADLKMYREDAEREIQLICTGNGLPSMLKVIEKIDL